MWVEILCGLVAYKIIRRVFFADDGDPSHLADLDSSHCFAVAAKFVSISFALSCPPHPVDYDSNSRLEKLYAGRCFVGLRIPDASARLHIDLVFVTNRGGKTPRRACNWKGCTAKSQLQVIP